MDQIWGTQEKELAWNSFESYSRGILAEVGGGQGWGGGECVDPHSEDLHEVGSQRNRRWRGTSSRQPKRNYILSGLGRRP